MPQPPHPSAPSALPPSPLVGEGRGPGPQAVGRVRGNADGLTKRQQLPASTVARSRTLGQEAGEPERRLWRALREALPKAKFRRQVPFGPYHADLCAHAVRLIVEVDGDDHAAKVKHNAARTLFLQNEGYDVIRFANADVMGSLEGVMTAIARAVATKQKGCP